MNIGSFGSKFADQPETGRPEAAYDKQPDVASRGDLRGRRKELAKIVGRDAVFRMPVQRGIDAGCGEDRVGGVSERPDDFGQRVT